MVRMMLKRLIMQVVVTMMNDIRSVLVVVTAVAVESLFLFVQHK